MIDETKLDFADWPVERRMICLWEAGEWLRKNQPDDYYVTWAHHAPIQQKNKEETIKQLREYAEDDIKFINAIFAFKCCITCTFDWINGGNIKV